MQSELKPCPFCGGPAHSTPSVKSANFAAVIMCTENDCASVFGADLEIATKTWNRRAIAAALSDKQAGEVKIKPLEWETREDGSYRGTSTIGCYHIFPGTGFSCDLCGPVGGRLATYKRLGEAKAAAQADYEQRIRSAMKPSGDQP